MTFHEIVFSAVVLWFIVKDAINHRRTDKLLNRIMAKNYEEYNYYEEKYPGDLKELDRIRDESRVERKEFTEKDVFQEDSGIDVTQFEEDWSVSELEQTPKERK